MEWVVSQFQSPPGFHLDVPGPCVHRVPLGSLVSSFVVKKCKWIYQSKLLKIFSGKYK